MINKQSGNVEQASKPGHHKYEMKRFDIVVQNGFEFLKLKYIVSQS